MDGRKKAENRLYGKKQYNRLYECLSLYRLVFYGRENGTNKDPKTVYFADAKSSFQLKWEDDSTLKVTNEKPGYSDSNRSAVLDVEDEIYDETGRACKSWVLKDKYDTCYQHNAGEES